MRPVRLLICTQGLSGQADRCSMPFTASTEGWWHVVTAHTPDSSNINCVGPQPSKHRRRDVAYSWRQLLQSRWRMLNRQSSQYHTEDDEAAVRSCVVTDTACRLGRARIKGVYPAFAQCIDTISCEPMHLLCSPPGHRPIRFICGRAVKSASHNIAEAAARLLGC